MAQNPQDPTEDDTTSQDRATRALRHRATNSRPTVSVGSSNAISTQEPRRGRSRAAFSAETPSDDARPRGQRREPVTSSFHGNNFGPGSPAQTELPGACPIIQLAPASAAQQQSLQCFRRTPFKANTSFERLCPIESYSYQTQKLHRIPGVFSKRFKYSAVCPSVPEDLGIDPIDLHPKVYGQMITPLGRIIPKRYVGMVISQAQLGIEVETGLIFVLDNPVPPDSPKIYLGQPFLEKHFDGGLPQLPQYVLANDEAPEPSSSPSQLRLKRKRPTSPDADLERRSRPPGS